jgi:hypothetical protein
MSHWELEVDRPEFDRYPTLYQFGRPVPTGSGTPGAFDEKAVDCPFVFQHDDAFYMTFITYPGEGYEVGPGRIGLAWSDDENLYHFYSACRPALPGDPAVNVGDEFRCITVATTIPSGGARSA